MQREYRVVITEPVQKWIDNLLKYSYSLDVSEISRIEKDLLNIYDAIFSLETYPYRIKKVDEKYVDSEVRRIWTDKYFIYFKIYENENVVAIVAITAMKGDQISQLKSFNEVSVMIE